jgi:hypothetical protein
MAKNGVSRTREEEILLADRGYLAVALGADRYTPRRAVDQGHLAENVVSPCFPQGTQPRHCPLGHYWAASVQSEGTMSEQGLNAFTNFTPTPLGPDLRDIAYVRVKAVLNFPTSKSWTNRGLASLYLSRYI